MGPTIMTEIDKLKQQWTSQEVASWLKQIGMEKYGATFVEELVDGKILLNDINEENLKFDLKVTSDDAPKIMRAINALKEKNEKKENIDKSPKCKKTHKN